MCSFITYSSFAAEGMWIPSAIPDSIYYAMLEDGLQLQKRDLYNEDSTSIKDAVGLFAGGCSSAIISNDGLVITNYHCARQYILNNSTIDNNLFEKGYSAKEFKEELPNKNISVEIICKTTNVTKQVLQGVLNTDNIKRRDSIIAKNIASIEKKVADSTHQKTSIKSFYYGNEYNLYQSIEYKDIRLVYCPPASIGDFGKDKDNWQWPSHKADFAIFRIYTDSVNQATVYSPKNIPLKPKEYLSIDIRNKKNKDFTFILGFPGNTEEYIPKDALELYRDSILPDRIQMRGNRLAVMNGTMSKLPIAELNYRTKYLTISNYFLKWESDFIQLQNPKVFDKKEKYYQSINTNYAQSLTQAYIDYYKNQKTVSFYFEGILSLEIVRFANVVKTYVEKNDPKYIEKLITSIRNFNRTYQKSIDIEYFSKLIEPCSTFNSPENTLPLFANHSINNLNYFSKRFKTSILLDTTQLIGLLQHDIVHAKEILEKDFIYTLSAQSYTLYSVLYDKELRNTAHIDSIQRLSLKGLMTQHTMYPDANQTLRLSYGTITKYEQTDGIELDYQTTVKGMVEKTGSRDSNYTVDTTLVNHFPINQPVCFISDCHTSGGNSGSPVLNSKGYMIGLNFDRNFDGTINDYIYNGEKARNIAVDMQFIYCILNEYNKSDYILKSLKIIH